MRFVDAPTRIPIQCKPESFLYSPGKKVVIGGELAFITDRTTWLYRPASNDLIQICPFHPEITMPADGFVTLQLHLYPVLRER